tara:strand:+ start:295 stop:615 length:321 start_codon:yes stop_codon:yes gene_type:complete
MEYHLETKVRASGKPVLFTGCFEPPGAVLSKAIFTGHQLAGTQRGLFFSWYRPGRPVKKESRWAGIKGSQDEKSLIPCMTAIAIEWLKFGGRSGRVKRKGAIGGAE